MASWMIHLRIADLILDQISDLSAEEFIMGNIAPDSGVPNEDWSAFTPSTAVSHFRQDDGSGKKKIDVTAYIDQYFSHELRTTYDHKTYSFFLWISDPPTDGLPVVRQNRPSSFGTAFSCRKSTNDCKNQRGLVRSGLFISSQ